MADDNNPFKKMLEGLLGQDKKMIEDLFGKDIGKSLGDLFNGAAGGDQYQPQPQPEPEAPKAPVRRTKKSSHRQDM